MGRSLNICGTIHWSQATYKNEKGTLSQPKKGIRLYSSFYKYVQATFIIPYEYLLQLQLLLCVAAGSAFLALSDFFIYFQNWKKNISGTHYESDNDVKGVVEIFLNNQEKSFYESWQKCDDIEGDNVKKTS